MIGKKYVRPSMFNLLIATAIATAPIDCQYLYAFDGDAISEALCLRPPSIVAIPKRMPTATGIA
jgi:hypothetical protein